MFQLRNYQEAKYCEQVENRRNENVGGFFRQFPHCFMLFYPAMFVLENNFMYIRFLNTLNLL